MEQKPQKMEGKPGLSRPESIDRLASHQLSSRNFSAARKYASLAQQSYPNRPEPAQIIAIADVLLAAADANRLPQKRTDWYAILQLQKTGPDCPSHSEIRTHFKDLVTLLNPDRNRFPLSDEAFALVCEAWRVLSNPVKKTQFDNEIAGSSFNLEKVEMAAATFWTVCPYCYCMHEYDRVYEGCVLRCQNCRRGFQGVAVATPGENVVVEGKDQYYCGFAFFPLKYCLGGKVSVQGGKEEDKVGCFSKKNVLKEGLEDKVGCFSEKKGLKEGLEDKDGCFIEKNGLKEGLEEDKDGFFGEKNGLKEGLKDKDGCFSKKKGLKEGLVDVVDISDDSDGGNVNGKESSGVEVEAGGENVSIGDQPSDPVEKLASGRKKKMARCLKKRLGTGRMKGMGIEEGGDQSLGASGSDEDEAFDDHELEFSFGEDDIYVGFKNG